MRAVAARIALLGVACCALLAPVGGQTLAAATAGGHGGNQGTQGHGRSAAASRSARHGGHRRGRRRHAGMSIGGYGYGDTYGSYASPAPAEADPYFSDPASIGYVPYCDPGSLYYDPSSCDDMTE